MNWKRWFAWKPVKIEGEWKWCCMVYRKPIPHTYVDYDDWQKYEYGDFFTVMRDQ